jgi:biopolymer transport protein ExbD
MLSDDHDGLIGGINVTPLVDVTLVLLVVMMVTAPLIAEASLSLKLPRAVPDGAAGDPARLMVELFADGSTRIDGQAANLEDVAARAASGAHVVATIRADGAVRHERVIHVLDVLRQAGIDRVAFAVAPADRR